ncbi:MAG: DUF935 family protein [Opitutus sp.]|nr:DUF935 family protein [Opitutus sp.]
MSPSPIIRPTARDFEPQLFGRSLSPDAIGELLDAGARGDLAAQSDLFNLMEDTWPRLRANLQKIKNAIRKLPLNVQPYTPKNGKPSATAQEKAAFVESALHLQRGYVDTTRAPLGSAVYELMDAVARGLSVVEIDWANDTTGYVVPVGFRRVPTRYLGIDTDGTLALRPSGAKRSASSSQLTPFAKHPGKFLTGIFQSKSGALGEAAQLRALAPLWLGHMLGWEWLVQKAELFGTPLRWANYPATATQVEIDAITSALRNMGTASWGAFPQGTNLQIMQGTTPGVSGPNDPSERLMGIADRACDIMLLGQNLSVEHNGEGSRAATEVHREVELDLFETYAEYIVAILNDQLIPQLIAQNWGTADEVPSSKSKSPAPSVSRKWPLATKPCLWTWACPSPCNTFTNATKSRRPPQAKPCFNRPNPPPHQCQRPLRPTPPRPAVADVVRPSMPPASPPHPSPVAKPPLWQPSPKN